MGIQWNPSIADTKGTNILNCPLQSDVPNSGASGIFLVGVVCVIGLLSTVSLRFLSVFLPYAGAEAKASSYILPVTWSANLMSSC